MTVPATIVQAAKDNISRLLEEAFQGTITFDPITVEPILDFYGEDALEIIVVYDGDDSLLDPHKLIRISSELYDILYDLGFVTVQGCGVELVELGLGMAGGGGDGYVI